MAPRLLITGATGIVGSELVRSLLGRPDPPRLLLALRGDEETVRVKRAWVIAWAGADAARATLVEAVAGDVRQPLFGLTDSSAARELADVTGVIHAAAVTEFEQSDDEAFANNVLGTRHALGVAQRCPRLDRFALISTAFSAGRRTGLIREDEVVSFEAGFANAYERSKALAEAEVQALAGRIPATIYRLGVIVGRQSDGHVSRMTALYPVLRLCHRGMVPMIPSDPSQPVDVSPVDVVARALAYLFLDAFEPGRTFHACAGPARSYAMDEFFGAVMKAFGDHDPDWRRNGYPVPLVVEPDVFESLAASIDVVENVRLRGILRIVRAFTRTIAYAKHYDTQAFDGALAGSGLAFPHCREWLPTIVGHAVAQQFRAARRAFGPS